LKGGGAIENPDRFSNIRRTLSVIERMAKHFLCAVCVMRVNFGWFRVYGSSDLFLGWMFPLFFSKKRTGHALFLKRLVCPAGAIYECFLGNGSINAERPRRFGTRSN